MYSDHCCVPERNNHGHTVIAYLKDDPEVKLYRTEVKDASTDNTTEKLGWDTHERSKAYAIDTLARDLEDGRVIPHSAETFSELRTFVHGERGKMAASLGTRTTG